MGTTAVLFQRTMPWQKHQFIVIDGQPLVYHGDINSLTVEMPGGTSRTLSELRAEGHAVHMPNMFRNELPGVRKNNPFLRAPHQSKSVGGMKIPKL